MTEIEKLQLELSNVKRDFNNLFLSSKHREKLLVAYIRTILTKLGFQEECIDKEMDELLSTPSLPSPE